MNNYLKKIVNWKKSKKYQNKSVKIKQAILIYNFYLEDMNISVNKKDENLKFENNLNK